MCVKSVVAVIFPPSIVSALTTFCHSVDNKLFEAQYKLHEFKMAALATCRFFWCFFLHFKGNFKWISLWQKRELGKLTKTSNSWVSQGEIQQHKPLSSIIYLLPALKLDELP